MASPNLTLLLIEDNPADARLLQLIFAADRTARAEIIHAERLAQGLEQLSKNHIDAILLDLSLPDSAGLDTLKRVRAHASNIPIVVLTGLDDEANALEAMRLGAQDYLVKGRVEPEVLSRTLRYAIERKRAEEALCASEERYRSLFEQALDGLALADVDTGILVDCNRALADLVGRNRAELIGQHQAILHPSAGDNTGFSPTFKQHLTDREGQTLETRVLTATGEIREVEIKANLLYLQGRKMLQGIFHDITERKRAEEALRESEERFRLSFENANVGMCLVDLAGRLTRVNHQMCEIFGYSQAELEGMTVNDIAYPEDLNISPAFIQRAVSGEVERTTFEKRYIHKDGHIVWGQVSSSLVRNAQGAPLYFISHVQDITARERAEETLRESEERYRTILENIEDGYFEVDLAGDFTFFNDSLCKILGYSRDEMMGMNNRQYMDEESAQKVYQVFNRVYTTGEPSVVFDWKIVRKDGEKRFNESAISLIRDSKGERIGFRGIVRDITARKRAEQEILQRNVELTVLNQVGQALNKLAEPSEILELVFTMIGRVLDNRNLYIALYDEANQFVSFPVYTMDGERRAASGRPLGNGVTEYVIRAKAPLFLPRDFRSEVEKRGIVAVGTPAQCFLAVPLLVGDKVIGTLALQDYERENAYDEHHLELLATIAAQAASALENARLFEEQQESLAMTTRLYELSAQVLSATTVEETARLVAETVRAGFAADACTIHLSNEDSGAPFWFSVGFSPDFHQEGRGRPHGLTARARASKEPIIATEEELDPHIRSEGMQTVIALPLPGETGNLGALFVGYRRPRQFSERERNLLSLFANHAALAFRRARLFSQAQQRLKELEAVSEISTALRSATTLDEMLPRFLDETLKLFGADSGVLSLYDPESHTLHEAVARSIRADQPPVPIHPGEGIVGHVFATGKPYSTREIRSDAHALESMRLSQPPGLGGACVPIRAAAEVIGALFVAVPSPREITSDEMRLLTTVAEIAGNAIHRTRLHDQTKRRLSEIQSLHTIDLAINASTDLCVTLTVILEQVTTQLQVDAASVLLLNSYTHLLDYAAGRGFRRRGIERLPLRAGEGWAGQAVLEQRTISTTNLAVGGAADARTRWLMSEGFISYFGVPLIAKGQVKGVLEICHRAPLAPDSEWLDFLETLAGEAALAIDSAELLNDLRRANVDLVAAYDATIEGWSRALDLRDKETEGHTLRVTEITLALARAMQVGEDELAHIRRGALLHDIGKLGVPDALLRKSGALDDAEGKLMRQHPELAYQLLAHIAYLQPALDIPYCHHERWDGTGYPRGLKGEQIPLAARIFAVADVWDALRSDRPYRKAWSEAQARAHIRAQSGAYFDPRVVNAFLDLEL